MSKLIKLFVTSAFLVFVLSAKMNAQTFEAGAALGMNISQIDGDKLHGFNRIGAFAGPIVHINTARRWQVATGILYSQLGSAANARTDPPSDYDKIRVNFVEVPLTLRFKDWLGEYENEEYFRVAFEAGLSYGRLINSKVSDIGGSDITATQDFNTNMFNIQFGATYFINPHWGVNMSWAKQFNNMDNREGSILVNRNINISLYYIL